MILHSNLNWKTLIHGFEVFRNLFYRLLVGVITTKDKCINSFLYMPQDKRNISKTNLTIFVENILACTSFSKKFSLKKKRRKYTCDQLPDKFVSLLTPRSPCAYIQCNKDNQQVL